MMSIRSILILSMIILCSCNGGLRSTFQRKERVYQPPRLGAEYRFEDGLRKQKNPQNLWSKKERKDMEKSGRYTPKETSAPNTRISPMQADSLLTGKTRDTAQSAPPPPPDSLQRREQP